MFGIGLQELVVILAIFLLLFGGKKIPELSRSLSEAIKELRRGFSDPLEDRTDDEKPEKKNKKASKS